MDVASILCFLTVVLFYITSHQTEAFLFNDCVFSTWGSWKAVNKNNILVKSERTRIVSRNPKKGGKPCPHLIESFDYSIRRTAAVLSKSFLKAGGTGSTDYDRDILLVVDSSGSIKEPQFTAAKPQLARLLGMVCPEPDPFRSKHRAALIQFSTIAVEHFDFDDKPSTLQVQQGIKNMVHYKQQTCTSKALTKALDMFNVAKGMRTGPNVTHELLLLSDGSPFCDGDSNEKQKAIEAAEALRFKGIEIYALVIGNYSVTGLDEMMKYVSAPMDQHLFAITGFQDLEVLVDYVQNEMNDPANKCASIG